MQKICGGWDELLKEDFESESYKKLRSFLASEYKTKSILPNMYNIFLALKLTPVDKVSVVILGQDPYPQKENAMGLAFSVSPMTPLPHSLRNIYKEIESDLNVKVNQDGDLRFWARQGVLLLNTTLTVVEGKSASHFGKGWEIFTDSVIRKISEQNNHLVFILWGANARAKKKLISSDNSHLIIESSHPSPLSAHNGFFGSKPFSRCNEYLIEYGKKPIYWTTNHINIM